MIHCTSWWDVFFWSSTREQSLRESPADGRPSVWVRVSVAQSCLTVCDPWTGAPRLLCTWGFPGKRTGMGHHALLQGTFPTQGSNPDLPRCDLVLHRLSHQGTPRMGSLSLLQGIFPTQVLNQALLHCSRLYQLSYQGSPRLAWVFWILFSTWTILVDHSHLRDVFPLTNNWEHRGALRMPWTGQCIWRSLATERAGSWSLHQHSWACKPPGLLLDVSWKLEDLGGSWVEF